MTAALAPPLAPTARQSPRSAPPAFGARIALGLGGVLLAVMCAQINDRVTAAAMPDLRGALHIGHDEGSWLTSLYDATQVSAMMFAPWCSATFSLRRFTIAALAVFALLGALCPFAPNVAALGMLRALQGFAGGCLPPMLMTVALRFLPPGIKLYGLGAYALTATFAPNLGTPLAALWVDHAGWRFVFWQIVPPALLAIGLVAYGVPQDPMRLERFRQFDWRGVLLGFPAITLPVLALTQGDRLGWTDSPAIVAMFAAGGIAMALFLINEWFHPMPFFKLQLLARRNLTYSLITLGGVLVILVCAPGVPFGYLAEVHGYRPAQSASLALCVALPQLIALPVVTAICNLRRVDCRWVLAGGLGQIALSCAAGTLLTADWQRENFYLLQALQVFGQPMTVVPLLMLATDGMTPLEGPFASAWFNTVKGFSVVVGGAVAEGFVTMREHLHSAHLVDRLAAHPQALALAQYDLANRLGLDRGALLALLDRRVRAQALVLASADTYWLMVALAVALIALIPLCPTRVHPPGAIATPSAP
ncbi:MFS transporter [Burkholderia alba]|uniref:MFS transporter n=1 Tax=Burkholderia alba TaxID=2683677 RepID=UPI002B060686|nr:MFS transporter [Burkholderia alba]